MNMKKRYIVFFACGALAMLGQWVINLGYIPAGKVITFGFGFAAMSVGFYCFGVSIRSRYFQPPE